MIPVMYDYQCPDHGVFDRLMDRREDTTTAECDCGHQSPRVLSPNRGKVRMGEVTRGKSDPLPSQVMDTRPLADGMPLAEFKKMRADKHRIERHAQIKKEMG